MRNRSYCSFIRICWGRCQLVPINTFIFSNSLDAFSKAGAAKPRIGDMALTGVERNKCIQRKKFNGEKQRACFKRPDLL